MMSGPSGLPNTGPLGSIGLGAKRGLSESRLALLLILPSLVLIGGIVLYPILNNLVISFFDYNLTIPWARPFIGLRNYVEVLTDREFLASVGRAAYFTVVSVSLELVLGLLIALFLNVDFRGRAFLKTMIILPWAVPTVVNAIMWKWIYDANYGALNGLLMQLGMIDQYQAWLAKPFTAMNLVILADVWHQTPFVVFILLATLSTIPESLYEAARVDGAGSLQAFRKITLPFLRPAFLIVLVIRTMEAFRVFDIIYVMTAGGPANGTQVATYYTYVETFRYLNMGKGAAQSFVISALIMLVSIVYIRLLKQDDTAY
ncbi:MAG TPA: sugar ABC transporter permease [Bacillota bacterium]|nr:sugar ABC transporter permease [Bacillota bacterium]